MSDSIGEPGSTQGGSPSIPGPIHADKTNTYVSSGYSSSNSLSHTQNSGKSSQDTDSLVELDAPVTTPRNSANYSDKAFDARMEGFRSVFSNFNASFFSGNDGKVDIHGFLADSKTMMMAFNGMISDIKALNGADSINANASIRANVSQQRLNAAELGNKIKEQGKEITNANEDLTEKSGEHSSLIMARQMKSKLIASLGDKAPPTLKIELLALDKKISMLASEISDLNGVIQSLTTKNAVSKSRLERIVLLVKLAEETVVNVKGFFISIKEQNDKHTLKTGEASVRKSKVDNQKAQHEASRESVRNNLKINKNRAKGKEVADQSIKNNENSQVTVISEELQELFSPALLTKLSTMFAATENAEYLEALSKKEPASNQDLVDTADALALALLATPPSFDNEEGVTASEKDPVDQPYLGDNISLEGADNPQAFKLLLQKNLISQLHQRVEHSQNLLSADAVDNALVEGILQLESEVNQMLAEAQRDSKEAEAVIVRNIPV